MSISKSVSVDPTPITDHMLDGWCDKYLAPLLDHPKKNEPGELWVAAGIVPEEYARNASLIKGAQTKLGPAFQSILYEIIKKNDRFVDWRNNIGYREGSKTTDISFSCKTNCVDATLPQQKTYNVYVQSSYNTKNSDGTDAIKNKAEIVPDAVAVKVLVQDRINAKNKRKEKPRAGTSPKKIWLMGAEAFKFFSDGDANLYQRLRGAFGRWKVRHEAEFHKFYPLPRAEELSSKIDQIRREFPEARAVLEDLRKTILRR